MKKKTSFREEPFYNYYVRKPLTEFWKQHRKKDQNVLFICGLGFNPRCTPAIKAMVKAIDNEAQFTTLCVRFINSIDSGYVEHYKKTLQCLEVIRKAADSVQDGYHHEIEVNLFDNEKNQIGDEMLIREFDEAVGSEFGFYSDIVVDVSAFPRSLMYTLIGHLWKLRNEMQKNDKYNQRVQNLFAVITHTHDDSETKRSKFVDTSYIQGDRRCHRKGDQVWVPILGDNIDRMDAIYNYLRPVEIFPIVPFPDRNLRRGDSLLTEYREIIFEKWRVPFENIMYASGDVPWDVCRKLSDFAELHKSTKPGSSLVISPLARRAISIGALVATLKHNLYTCHIQPAEYTMEQEKRDRIWEECESAEITLYWLAGSLYDDIPTEGARK